MKNKSFCIVGIGLLGGCYAAALSAQKINVTAIDINNESLEYSLNKGIISNGAAPKTPKSEQLLQNADCVVLALYPSDILPWVRQNAALLKGSAILTDVTGVKGNMIEQVQALLQNNTEFISCHPMAGREASGVQNASADIIRGANFIITPTQSNTENGIKFARELAVALGFGKISILSPLEHDKMIGYVSQLTHAIAVSLMNASDNTHLADYTGDSFRDLTRIARINENMWCELFMQNREILSSEIDLFCASMQGLKQMLNEKNENGLKQLFITSTQRRAAFDKKQ